MKHKDGIDRYPTVDAKDWREAIELASGGATFRCADGWMITFGTKTIKVRT